MDKRNVSSFLFSYLEKSSHEFEANAVSRTYRQSQARTISLWGFTTQLD
jgi:hypothetical protein